jgi:hypothetical protein
LAHTKHAPGPSSLIAGAIDRLIVDFAFVNDGNEAVTLDNESLKLLDSQGRESGTRAELSSYVPEDRRIFLERINPGVTEKDRPSSRSRPVLRGSGCWRGTRRCSQTSRATWISGFRGPKRKRMLAKLQCNSCGHPFEDEAWFVSIESEERGTIGWNQDSTEGVTCESCGSRFIRFQ